MASIVVSGDTSGAITLSAPSVAGTNTITLPAATGTAMVSGNMPAFSAYNSSTQSISNITFTKVVLNSEDYDTANCFDSTTNYRFTPNVAGYYQINAWMAGPSSNTQNTVLVIYKNGSIYKTIGASQNLNASTVINNGVSGGLSMLLNGSTDYIELYVYQQSGSTQALGTTTNGYYTYMTGALVRAA